MLCLLHCSAWAGPPFLTDDPEPVPLHHYETYLFCNSDSTAMGTVTQGPATEFNWGALPNLQLHVVLPMSAAFLPAGQRFFGFGDIEAGAKYRFIQESGNRPQVGVFPMLEIPSGDARRDLGNGQLWARLPLWIQKSFGPWTTYGGGGEAIDGAPGTRNFPFAGWLVQRNINKKLTLGTELYAHGTEGLATFNPRASALLDLGGSYNISPGFSLLFAAGHSVAGQAETYAYLGLYWTWGPAAGK
jgi:hypothetical protein